MYLEYEKLNKMIEKFRKKTKKGQLLKLPGYYVFDEN